MKKIIKMHDDITLMQQQKFLKTVKNWMKTGLLAYQQLKSEFRSIIILSGMSKPLTINSI